MTLRGKKRYLLVALITAVAVMGAGLYVVQFLPGVIPQNRSDEILRSWLEANSPLRVRAGYLTPLFYPGLGFQARHLVVGFKDGGELFRARAIKVVADEGELLHRRRVMVKEVIIEHPELTLVMEPSGKFNVSRWGERVAAAVEEQKKKQEPESSLLLWRMKEMARQLKPTADTSLPGLLRLEAITIKDAELHLRDECESKTFLLAPVDLSGINLHFRGARLGQPAAFRLSLPLPSPSEGGSEMLRLEGTLVAPSNNEIHLTSLAGRWAGVEIARLTGTLQLRPLHFDAQLEAAMDFPSLHRAATWPPVAHSKTIPDMEGEGGGTLSLHVWGPAPERLTKMHYTGEIKLNKMWWWPGRVVAPIRGEGAVLYLEDGRVRMPEITAEVGGNVITAGGFLEEARLPRFNVQARADFVDFQTFFRRRKTPYQEGRPMLIMRTRWGGEFRLREGVYKKIRISDAHGVWNVTNHRLLTFSKLTFKACGGTYTESGRSFVDFDHPTTYKFRFDGQIRAMDVTSFVDQLFNTTVFLHGTADADGFLTGIFQQGKFVPASLGGDLKLRIRDGHFEGFNVVGKIHELFRLQVPEEFQSQKFKLLTATVHFEEGVAYTEDLQVESSFLAAQVKGFIDFARKECDLKIKLNFLRPVTAVMDRLPVVGVILGPAGDVVSSLYVRVHGPWDHLQYSPWNPWLERDSSPSSRPRLSDSPN